MRYPTNKEQILHLTESSNRLTRIGRIESMLQRPYKIQAERHSGDDIKNIIVPAKDQKNKILIVAHHDLYPGSHGYNDNTTGGVTLLNLQNRVPDNVELLFTDYEEFGGKGCIAYLEKNAPPKFAINIDVVGLGEKIFYEMYGPPFHIDIPEDLDIEYFGSVPFNDACILRNFNVPTVFLFTGPQKTDLLSIIWKAPHCGSDDGNLDLISETVMDRVAEATLKIIENNC